MNLIDLMKDPYYAGIMFEIENAIYKVDREAALEGVSLTDSNIKSSLRKGIGFAKGKTPKLEKV